MSFTSTISNALSGLQANARAAGVVSDNIANATNENFGRREIGIAARESGGVRVQGVRRVEDPRLSAELRTAEAAREAAGVVQGALTKIERAIGTPDEPGSLGARLAGLEAALVEAAADPASEARLTATLRTLQDVAAGLGVASGALEETRTEVEAGIDTDVRALRDALSSIAELNVQIARGKATKRDVSALLDQRRAAMDDVARIAPVRSFEKPDGMVALIAQGGAMLIDGARPAEIGFEAAGLVTAEMDVDAGSLSRVTLRGEPVNPAGSGGALSGGTLGAKLKLRDETIPGIQARLDAVAASLAERLGPGGPDASLAPGDAGLLTDRGMPVAAAPVPGLAGRLQVNAAVDPARGGELRRLRDGIDAPAGPAGRSELLRGMADALSSPMAPPPGFAAGARDVSGLVADALSGVASSRLVAERDGARAGATAETLRQEERAKGVDTDVELQTLMAIERSYAAGAKVLQAVDEMLFRILEI